MISINDTHPAPKAAPSYRVRTEAIAAAVAVLGPLAIHEFDFVTYQLDDGRWDWNVPGEPQPLSAAVIKANGGKKFLAVRAKQAAMANAITQHEGTAMADPNRLPVPLRRALGKAAGASKGSGDPAVAPLSPAAAQLGRMGFTDVAENPSDGIAPACNGLDIKSTPSSTGTYGLDIPDFLKRESTPQAKEQAEKAMKRLAKQVGPDRTIKNPPDAKPKAKPSPTAIVPGTDTSKWGKDRAARRKAKDETSAAPVSDSPKAKKPASEAKTKTAGHFGEYATKAALIKAGIAAGHDDEKIVKDVNKDFPGCNYQAKDIKFYRRKMAKAA